MCADNWKLINSNDDQIGLNGSLMVTGSEVYSEENNNILSQNTNDIKGFMKFNRRFDDCNIESQAVGAVPYNFVPLPHRTPEETPRQESQ